jgi:hypothetical protein
MDPESLKGNPLVFNNLKPDLGGKVVKAVADDMERARLEAEEKARKQKKAGKKAGKRG